MIKIILISHGPYCHGLLKSLLMIAGPTSDLVAVELHEGETPEAYRNRLEQEIKGELKSLILCDVRGGTPYNSAAFLAKKYPFLLITGMNMPMLLSIVTLRNEQLNLKDLAKMTIQSDNLGVDLIDFRTGGKGHHAKLSINKD